ncbi:nuclear transport factor 2 family protein [Pedobacter foliorum]|uniref:nuclear transport factor 2 family protein n=1 Tax=Pedobacter foliorum TaxID=2739058 RepID=UPI001566CD62|nr:nuclear transport factor 2 family protein [Pedobacter foliorum]NRF37914.1 nuclear transport factor 2 family protein [Pedobacter foliorum]
MKRKILLCVAILSISFTSAFADNGKPAASVNLKSSSVIEAYIDANVHCNAALLNQVMHNEAVLKITRQGKIVEQTKKELVDFYKKRGDITLNCTPNFEILSSCDCVVMVRVDFKYPLFTQQNYVTIVKDEEGVWKISQINRFNG